MRHDINRQFADALRIFADQVEVSDKKAVTLTAQLVESTGFVKHVDMFEGGNSILPALGALEIHKKELIRKCCEK